MWEELCEGIESVLGSSSITAARKTTVMVSERRRAWMIIKEEQWH